MLIVWGKKVVRRRLGRAAWFCPICRGLAISRVTVLKSVPHVYYLPLGGGKVVAHEMSCEGCGVLRASQDLPFWAVSRSPTTDVVELAMETSPDLTERWGPRLEAEDRIADGALSPDERAALITEPFMALEYMVRRKAGGGNIPTITGVSIIILVFLIPLTIVLCLDPSVNGDVKVILAGLVVALAIAGALGWRDGGRGWVGRTAVPLLARALEPLRPTPEEVRGALAQLKASGVIVGKRIKPEWVIEALETRPHSPAPAHAAAAR